MTDNPTPNEIALLLEALKDPNAVHANMLRGEIAKPSVAQIIHIYGEETIRAALAPGQHDGAAGEGLTITDDEIDDAIAHGFGENFTERAQSITPKPSTEQARAAEPSDSVMLQARFNEIIAEIDTTGRCLLRKNDLGDLLAAASALAATPSSADALGDRL